MGTNESKNKKKKSKIEKRDYQKLRESLNISSKSFAVTGLGEQDRVLCCSKVPCTN